MISRKLAGASAAGVGAVTAVTALLLGTMSGTAAEEPTASAYGLAAQGVLPIAPTPQVEAPPGGDQAVLEVPSPLGVGVLRAEASDYQSRATAVDLNIADLVQAAVIEATCDNASGAASLINAVVAGTELPSAPGVGESIDLSPIVKIELNRQSQDDNGNLTVDALAISVLPGGQPNLQITPQSLDQLTDLVPNLRVPTMEDLQAKQPTAESGLPTVEDLLRELQALNPNVQVPLANGDSLLEVVVSSATCGVPEEDEGEATPPAPKPTPVETQLPVTH